VTLIISQDVGIIDFPVAPDRDRRRTIPQTLSLPLVGRRRRFLLTRETGEVARREYAA
jgi:hypothetical protein